MSRTTKSSLKIDAPAEKVWQAFANPSALETWLVPGNMTGKIHEFEFRTGGGYTMSLFYPESETRTKGKTTDREDRYSCTYAEIVPHEKIVQVIHFDSPDPDFSEEMIIEITLEESENTTLVTFTYRNIPKGIRPEDNEAGTISSLKKLAKLVE